MPVLSLGNIRLHIIYIGTIAGQKLTKDYVALCSITDITFHYFDSPMAAAFGIL